MPTLCMVHAWDIEYACIMPGKDLGPDILITYTGQSQYLSKDSDFLYIRAGSGNQK